MDTIKINREELERVYLEKGIAFTARHFDVTQPQIYKLLDQMGVPRNMPSNEGRPKRRIVLGD